MDCERLHYPLVRYYHDCLAAQTDWARAVNVIEQKDVRLLALSADEQHRLNTDRMLRLNDVLAVDFAKRFSAGGADTSPFSGSSVPGGSHTATGRADGKVILRTAA